MIELLKVFGVIILLVIAMENVRDIYRGFVPLTLRVNHYVTVDNGGSYELLESVITKEGQ